MIVFREAIYFIAFTIFLLVQYCIGVTSIFIVNHLNAEGLVYWCIVVVIFLAINQFVFGSFSYELDSREEDDDESWLNETEL